jgi:hypothetical protein
MGGVRAIFKQTKKNWGKREEKKREGRVENCLKGKKTKGGNLGKVKMEGGEYVYEVIDLKPGF